MTKYSLKEMGIDQRIYDQRAWSRADLFRELGGSQADLSIYIQTRLDSGEWERVWKRDENGRRLKAYRRKS
jgi:hypothetical protein